MRLLGVDLGRRQIGIAIGISPDGPATPRPPIMATGVLAKDANLVSDLARKEEVQRVILGIPLHTEEKRAEITRRFQQLLIDQGLEVALVDESYTSKDAVLELQGMTRAERERWIDSFAACLILERYFEGEPHPN